jgi:hypothetical protein
MGSYRLMRGKCKLATLFLLGLDAVTVMREGGMYLLEKALLVTIVPARQILYICEMERRSNVSKCFKQAKSS